MTREIGFKPVISSRICRVLVTTMTISRNLGYGLPRALVSDKEIADMLWTIAVVLVVLWALGMVTSYTLAGFIHILLLLAIIVVLIRVIQGRSPVL